MCVIYSSISSLTKARFGNKTTDVSKEMSGMWCFLLILLSQFLIMLGLGGLVGFFSLRNRQQNNKCYHYATGESVHKTLI